MEMERGVGKTGKQRCGSSGGTDLKGELGQSWRILNFKPRNQVKI